MKIKFFRRQVTALLLAAAMVTTAMPANIFAASNNRLNADEVSIKSMKAVSPDDPVLLKIYPKDAVESNSSVIISLENGIFDESAWYEKSGDDFYYGGKDYNSSNELYDEITKLYSQKISSGVTESTAIQESTQYIMGSKTNHLPYSLKFLSSEEMEVTLFPVTAKDADSSKNSLTTCGKVCYCIPLPIISANGDDIKVTVDSNGTSVTGGTYTINTDLNCISSADVKIPKQAVSEQGKALSPANPLSVKIYPKDTVSYDRLNNISSTSYYTAKTITITVNNGTFNAEEWANQGGTGFYYGGADFADDDSAFEDAFWRFDTNLSGGINERTAISNAVSNYMSSKTNCLPYSTSIISDTQMEVQLFPVLEADTDNTTNNLTTCGKVCYNIALPVISNGGDVSISISGKPDEDYVIAKADEESCASLCGYAHATDQPQVTAGSAISPDDPVCLKIYPTSEVEAGTSINIYAENGSFDASNGNYYYNGKTFGSDNSLYESIYENYELYADSGLKKSTIISYAVSGTMGSKTNCMPYRIDSISSGKMTVTLFPVAETDTDTTSNMLTTMGKVCYKIALPVTAAANGDVNVTVKGFEDTAGNTAYKIAEAVNNPENTSKIYGDASVSKKASVYTYGAVSPSNPVCLNVYPKDTVKAGSAIKISIDNGTFDTENWAEQGGTDYYYNGPNYTDSNEVYDETYSAYETNILGGIDERNAGALAAASLMGSKSNCLPYRIDDISENQMTVELFPVAEADTDNATNNYTTLGKVKYCIPLPASAAENTGDITITVEDNEDYLTDGGTYTIASAEKAKGTTTSSIEEKDVIPFYSRLNVGNITIKEDNAGIFTGGTDIVLTLNDGFVFAENYQAAKGIGSVSMGVNCEASGMSFDKITFTADNLSDDKKSLTFQIPDVFGEGTSTKACSLILSDIVIAADTENSVFGDALITISGESITTETIKAGTRTDYGFTAAAAEEPTSIIGGRSYYYNSSLDKDSFKTAEITISENVADSWDTSSPLEFTMPEGIKILGYENIGVNNIAVSNTEFGWGDYAEITNNGRTLKISGLDKYDYTVYDDEISQFGIRFYISAAASYEGDVSVSISGAGIAEGSIEPIAIANIVPPVTVTAENTTIGTNSQTAKTADIVITENAAGALMEGGSVSIAFDGAEGLSFADNNMTISCSGDIEVSGLTVGSGSFGLSSSSDVNALLWSRNENEDNAITFNVDKASTQPSTITISNVSISADSAANGTYGIKIGDNAVINNYCQNAKELEIVTYDDMIDCYPYISCFGTESGSALSISGYVTVSDGTAIDTMLGDGDNDGVLTASDAAITLQKVLDADYKIIVDEKVLDVDGDGTLTASDAAYILQKVLDADFSFPIE